MYSITNNAEHDDKGNTAGALIEDSKFDKQFEDAK